MRLLALLALAAGCFGQPLEDECRVRCGDGSACPADYRCGADDFCHPADLDEPRVCSGGGGDADAGDCAAPVAVAAGSNHTCAVLSDGRAYCWGTNCHGELGNPDVPVGPADCGDAERSLSPVPVVRGGQLLAGVREIHPGFEHTCALLDDGTAVCWGDDGNGQLGRDGDGGVHVDPAPVVRGGEPLTGLSHVASGWLHSCAVDPAGNAWCWGNDNEGELGDGNLDDRSSAFPVDTTAAFTAIAGGSSHTCAIDDAGGAWCWGADDHGQLGGSATQEMTPETRPIELLDESDDMPLEEVTAIATGNDLGCAVAAEAAFCWGENTSHAVGDDSCPTCADGYNQWLAVPVELTTASPIVQVSAGGHGACALEESGALWCWGASDELQIGIDTPEPWLGPTRVMDGVTAVAVGFDHACAIAGGQVLCWGRNLTGELGTGSPDSTDTPTPVAEMCP